MFATKYNDKIAEACLALNRRKIDNLEGIETGDAFENIAKSEGSQKMEGGRRNKRKNTRQEEFDAVSKMDILPRNTNLPDNSKSTLNSNRYLPIKQSGAFQTPNTVLQFYHTGGIQGSGIGEAEIEKIEGGNRFVGCGEDDRDVVENLSGRMSELSGFGKPSMFKLLNKLKKKLKGRGWMDSIMSGLNLVSKHLPTIIEHAPTVLKHAGDVASFLGFGKKGKKAVLDTKLIEHLAQIGAKEFKVGGNMYGMLDELLPSKTGSGIFGSLLGMFGLGKHELQTVKGAGILSGLLSQFGLGKPSVDSIEGRGILSGLLSQFGLGKPDLEGSGILSGLLSQFGFGKPFGDVDLGSDARFLSHGEGKVRKIRRSKKGGYDINITPPLPVVAPIEDLRGTIRPEVEGGKAKLSKAKLRGLKVAKIMREQKVPLGVASKIVSEGVKKHGGEFFDDVFDGFLSIWDAGSEIAKLAKPFIKGKGEEEKLVEGGAKLSKAKLRGMAVAKIMKERGVKLGEASKIVSEGVKLKGMGFFNDLLDGFSKVVDVGLKVAPLFI